jgi:hypothetical protein
MRDDTPSVYLLAGPAGPAKSAYARVLIEHGVAEVEVRSAERSPDGRVAETAHTLIEHVRTGRDAFLDHDLVPVDERDRYKALVEEHGGQWCLITFTVDHSALANRFGASHS